MTFLCTELREKKVLEIDFFASDCKGRGKETCHSRRSCKLIQEDKEGKKEEGKKGEGKKGVGRRVGFLTLLSCGSVMQAVFMK